MKFYSTKTDAVSQAIVPALGEWPDDYDVDGIFMDAFEWDAEKQAFFRCVDDRDFWLIVEANELDG